MFYRDQFYGTFLDKLVWIFRSGISYPHFTTFTHIGGNSTGIVPCLTRGLVSGFYEKYTLVIHINYGSPCRSTLHPVPLVMSYRGPNMDVIHRHIMFHVKPEGGSKNPRK